MQTWHCIVIIALTIGGFMYATFLKEIDRESELTLEQLGSSVNTPLTTQEDPPIDFGREKTNQKSTWAQKVLILQPKERTGSIIDLHQKAMGGEYFFTILLEELSSTEHTKGLIFSAFKSDLHSLDERTILESLISSIPDTSDGLSIICRGHSQRTADLLAEFILRTYPKALALEKNDQPLLPELREKLLSISLLEKEAGELKLIIHEELKDSPEDSIEVMALQSEILQIDQEVGSLKTHLIEIDSIHRNRKHPMNYLQVKPIAEFGNIKELSDILAQLKSLDKSTDLNDYTKKEVENNIKATSESLESAVVLAIDQIKGTVEDLLARKKTLQTAVIDTLETERLAVTKNPAVEKLDDVRKRLALLKNEFDARNLEWMTAKKSFSLFPKPI